MFLGGNNVRRTNRFRTICEVLREINDSVQGDTEKDAKLRLLLNEAFTMAKKIVYKLYEYNKAACAGFWKRNPRQQRRIEEELRRGINYKPLKYNKGTGAKIYEDKDDGLDEESDAITPDKKE